MYRPSRGSKEAQDINIVGVCLPSITDPCKICESGRYLTRLPFNPIFRRLVVAAAFRVKIQNEVFCFRFYINLRLHNCKRYDLFRSPALKLYGCTAGSIGFDRVALFSAVYCLRRYKRAVYIDFNFRFRACWCINRKRNSQRAVLCDFGSMERACNYCLIVEWLDRYKLVIQVV